MRHIIILLALLCVSCSSALPSLKPYRMDIQQGNVVTSKMIMQLRPGMTKSQVRFIMGTPLIQDTFHSNRWDYFYQMRQQGKIIEQRRVILEFENEALARVRGDVIPAGTGQQDLATPATTPESLSKADGAKGKKDEKGLVDKLKFWKSDEDEKKGDEQPAVVTVPPEQAAPAPAPTPAPASPETAPAAKSGATVKPAGESAPIEEDVPYVEPVREPVEGKPISDSEPVAAPQTTPADEKPVADTSPEADESRSEAGDDSTQLMLDRDIDLPADPGNPSNVSNPSKAPDADLPSEASPEFFERMLEKIGF